MWKDSLTETVNRNFTLCVTRNCEGTLSGFAQKAKIPHTAVWGSSSPFYKLQSFEVGRIPHTAVWGWFKSGLFILPFNTNPSVNS